MTYAYIGLGGNRGRPRRQLAAGVRRLANLPASRLTAVSPVYYSAPVGCPGRQQSYYNAVAELQTLLPPPRLFSRLQAVERRIQQRRRASKAPRRLDIDYLAHGTARACHPRLILPHPRLYRRAFALRPLLDVLQAGKRRAPDTIKIRRALAACREQKLQRR